MIENNWNIYYDICKTFFFAKVTKDNKIRIDNKKLIKIKYKFLSLL